MSNRENKIIVCSFFDSILDAVTSAYYEDSQSIRFETPTPSAGRLVGWSTQQVSAPNQLLPHFSFF